MNGRERHRDLIDCAYERQHEEIKKTRGKRQKAMVRFVSPFGEYPYHSLPKIRKPRVWLNPQTGSVCVTIERNIFSPHSGIQNVDSILR